MKYLASLFAVTFIVVRCYCGEWLPLPNGVSWETLTNTANFHEVHSTTNLPPEVVTYVLSLPLGVQASDRKKMAELGEPLAAGFRLVWAATDGSDYIVHYEFVTSFGSTNFCIAAAHRNSKDEAWKCSNGGFLHRFKDYKDFIDYDMHIPSNG
jgi:hypothetical protein